MTRHAAPLAAFVLRHHDWSESSLVLDLFTRERGRLVAVAKGAKRPTSQLRPVLLPFLRLAVTLGRPPADGGEVQLLRGAEWVGGSTLPVGDALFAGYYANELLLALLAREDPHPALFDAYALTLPALAGAEPAALRAFELRLLHGIGLLPALDVETATQAALADGRGYALDAEHGVVAARGDAPALPAALLRALHAALAADDVAALQAACRAGGGAALRLQLRGLLHYHLGTATLRSREVLRQVQRLAASP
jgi:DNA repair protein RecO (recombination protein O)